MIFGDLDDVCYGCDSHRRQLGLDGFDSFGEIRDFTGDEVDAMAAAVGAAQVSIAAQQQKLNDTRGSWWNPLTYVGAASDVARNLQNLIDTSQKALDNLAAAAPGVIASRDTDRYNGWMQAVATAGDTKVFNQIVSMADPTAQVTVPAAETLKQIASGAKIGLPLVGAVAVGLGILYLLKRK